MRYNPAFDGLRALAILPVVFFHCQGPWFGGGYLGVDIFFVLSGYLITLLLATEHASGGIQVGRFYARRALRLYPTLILMLAAYLVLAPTLWPGDDRWLNAVLAGTYVTDYSLPYWRVPHYPPVVGHTWSLAVEEKFYLVWPLLLLLLLLSRVKRPIAWLLAAFVMATAWRCIAAHVRSWPMAYFPFDARLSGLLLGSIAALARPKVSGAAAAIAGICLAITVVVPGLPSPPHLAPVEAVTFVVTLAELSAFLVICHVAERMDTPVLSALPLVYVGRLSYGIYLWHFPIILWLRERLPVWPTLGLTLLISFTLAAVCLHLVDTPIKRWRRHLLSSAEAGTAGHLRRPS
jgi:peptidoglycan/LPS O-acetylase OafA/YrhL